MHRPSSLLLACLLGTMLSLGPGSVCDLWAMGESFQGLSVSSFEIEGLPTPLASELKSGLRLAHKPGLLGIFRSAIFDSETLDRDLDRARLFLARQGFPAAEIEVQLESDEKGKQIGVRFLVSPGPPVRIRTLDLVDFPSGLSPENLKRAQSLQVGDRFVDSEASVTSRSLQLELRRGGYADATLELQIELLDAESVALRYLAKPGPHYTIGQLSVSGPSEDLIPVVERVVKVPTGEPYSPTTISDIEWRLRQLNLFRRIDLVAAVADSQVLDLNYELTERLHRRWELGVGWFTDEKWRVGASWEHRNLFKAGRGLRLSAVKSSIIANIIASTWWPAVWSTPYTLILSLDFKLEEEEGYDQTEDKIALSAVYRPRNGSVFTLGYSLSYIDLQDNTLEPSADQDPEGLLNRIFFSAQLDQRNDLLEPTSGQAYFLRIQATPPGLGSVDHYAKTHMGVSTVHRLKGSLFLAVRGALGMGVPFEDSQDIIISERFFSGGARSHRGYQRHRLGPKDAIGNPLGGEVQWESSAEFRFPLWKRLSGALFVDVAQVWRSRDVLLDGGFEWAVGPSIGVSTPVGPIRLDYGFRVPSADDGEPNQVLHLQVGYPF